MTISENPFTNLLSGFNPQFYYGRDDLARMILGGIAKPYPESFVLWGLYGIGKTSLWRYVVSKAGEEPQPAFPVAPVFIYVDFYAPGREQPLTARDVFAAIHAQVVTHPQMYEVLAEIGAAPTDSEHAEAVGELAFQARRRKLLLVICLDHFDNVVRTAMKEVEAQLVALKRHAALIILLDADPAALLGPYVAKTPVFRDMNAKPVRALSEEAACKLLTMPAGEAAFPDGDIAFLLQQAGRHPYLLLLAAEWLFAARALYLPVGSRDSLVETRPAVVGGLEQQRRIQEVLYVLWKGLSPVERRLLYAIGSRSFRGVDARPQSQVDRDALLALGQKELVAVDAAGKYTVTIGLLGAYASRQEPVTDLDEAEQELAPHDRRLFRYLREREGQVCSLAELYREFWRGEENQAALAASISRIRAKIPKEYIRNKRGQGYVFLRTKSSG